MKTETQTSARLALISKLIEPMSLANFTGLTQPSPNPAAR